MPYSPFLERINIRSAVAAAVDNVAKESIPVLKAAAQAIGKGNRTSRVNFENTHKTLLELAKEAVFSAYDERVKGPSPGPYRQGTKHLSGGLEKALNDPGMFVSTYTSIKLFNKKILDANAAHWYRLNSGAGAAAASGQTMYVPQMANVTLAGRSIAKLLMRSTRGGDIKPVMMPRGVFFGERPSPFGPTGQTADIPTKGIVARRFLEPGVEVLAESLGPAYESLVRRLVMEAASTGRGAGTAITVKPKLLGL